MSKPIPDKVLVFAPEEVHRELGLSDLWRGNVEVVTAICPDDVVEAVIKERAKLVVLEVSTQEFAQAQLAALRNHPETRSMGIVITSRHLEAADERELLRRGANLVLPFPVNPLLWAGRLEELLQVLPRRDARLPIRLKVWSRFDRPDVEIEGIVVNVAAGGALIELGSEVGIELGQNLDLVFRLPGDPEEARLIGRIVRTQRSRQEALQIGVRFILARGTARQRISSFVEAAHFGLRSLAAGSLAQPLPFADEDDLWETELRSSEARKLAILDSALDGIITLDGEGSVLEFNAAAEQIFGRRRAEVLGVRIDDILVPSDLRGVAQRYAREFLTSDEVRLPEGVFETRALRFDGTEFPVEVSVSPMIVGSRLLFTAYVRDISERIAVSEIEGLLRDEERRASELRASLRQKEALLKEIHHRVKNNLQVISSLLGLQARSCDDPGATAVLRVSRNRVRSMAMVHELLYRSPDLASIDAQAYLSRLGSELVATYLVEGQTQLRIEAETVRLETDTAIPCALIVNELVSNALEHAFPESHHGSVLVAIRRLDEARLELEVSDDGAGLPAGWSPGSTLGLMLVESLVKQLRGTFEIVSPPGTRVLVRFPSAPESSSLAH